MIAFSRNALAAVAITMSLSPSALACLRLYGTIYQDFTAEDNGVNTCVGTIETGDNNLDCIDGYSLNYDYSDNTFQGPMPITYCNPQNCYGIDVPLSCTGAFCTFDYTTFCG